MTPDIIVDFSGETLADEGSAVAQCQRCDSAQMWWGIGDDVYFRARAWAAEHALDEYAHGVAKLSIGQPGYRRDESDEEREARVLAAYAEHGSTGAAARAAGVGDDTARRILREHGIRGQRQPLPDEAFAELHAEGLTTPEAAKRLGVTNQTVTKRLRKLGIEPRHGAGGWGMQHAALAAARQTRVRALIADGLTSPEIARQLRVSVGTVANDRRALRERGELPEDTRRADAEERRSQVLALSLEGLKLAEIAERMGISRAMVNDDLGLLRKRGELPGRGEQ